MEIPPPNLATGLHTGTNLIIIILVIMAKGIYKNLKDISIILPVQYDQLECTIVAVLILTYCNAKYKAINSKTRYPKASFASTFAINFLMSIFTEKYPITKKGKKFRDLSMTKRLPINVGINGASKDSKTEKNIIIMGFLSHLFGTTRISKRQ